MHTKQSFIIIFLWHLAILVSVSCRNTRSLSSVVQNVEQAQPLTISFDSMSRLYNGITNKSTIAELYRSRIGVPMWADEKGLSPQGDSLIALISKAKYYGLPASRYQPEEIANALAGGTDSVERLEILLTTAFIDLSREVRLGVTPSGTNADSVSLNYLRHADKTTDVNKFLSEQEPKFAGYRSLKSFLKVFIDSLEANKATDPDRLSRTIHTIAINMQRWREENFSDRYVIVNVPSFMVHVVENDSIVFSSKVIVGKPETPTPVLSSVIECFTVFPYWYVPRSIAVGEYLPEIQKSTTFIQRNFFDVLDKKGKVLNPDSIDWKKFNSKNFPVTLRQREGAENALGILKFVFDNPYAVYLHDTNQRAYSESNHARSATAAFGLKEPLISLTTWQLVRSTRKCRFLKVTFPKKNEKQSIFRNLFRFISDISPARS